MNRLTLQLISVFTLISFFFTFTLSPVLAAVTYLYDANGNMTSDGTKCFEYNEANQLKKVKKCSDSQTIAEYVYDHMGKRVVKKEYENGSLKRTIFSPSDEYETVKLASNGATQNTVYYKANDEVVAKKNPDGTKTFYHNDHLGSNSVLTNQAGTVVEKTSYEPYGEVKSGGTKSKFGYTGQEKDNETGLNYYDSRYYDPHLQRFIQPDTWLPDVYDPQQLNRYSYANNNPLRYTDPSGHIAFLAIPLAYWVGAALATAAIYFATPQGQQQTKTAITTVVKITSQLVSQAKTIVTSTYNAAKTTITSQSQNKPTTQNPTVNNSSQRGQPQVKPQAGNSGKGNSPEIKNWDPNRNPKQDKRLSNPEIDRLKKGGKDIEALKDDRSDLDLFKDPKKGDIYVKPKNGRGPGEPLDININDY